MTSRKEIRDIKRAAGGFSKEALEARKAYLDLRLKQDPEIRKIMVRSADRIAEELRAGGQSVPRKKQLKGIEASLRTEAEIINRELTEKVGGYIETGAAAATTFGKSVLISGLDQAGKLPGVSKAGIEQMYFRVNRSAVEACWSRTQRGLRLSDRIWDTSQQATQAMTNIIQDAVARGQDAVTTARQLEQYVKKGSNVLSGSYKGMMARMKGRIPRDLSYQALRLARTEMTAAYGQATIQSAQATPGVVGIRYCLSSAHRIYDICDILASTDDYGLGPGVYPSSSPPPFPAHPNTTSYLATVMQDTEDFVRDLKQWVNDPDSQPELNDWYENIYLPKTGNGIITSSTSSSAPLSSGKVGDTDGETVITTIMQIDFNDGKAVTREIENFCEQYAYADVEHALEITPSGKAYSLTGEKTSVNSSLAGMDELKGSIGIHNHPVEAGQKMYDSFSLSDLKFVAASQAGKQYLISGERRNAFEFTKEFTEQEIYEAWQKAKTILLERALAGEVSIEAEQEQILKILNEILEGFVFYEDF